MEESYCLSDEASQIVFARVYNLGWAGFPGILSTLQNNESFSLFVKLATLLSLGEKLENEQGLTLFIPDDQVLKKYNDILSKTIGSNIELISTIIKNHIFCQSHIAAVHRFHASQVFLQCSFCAYLLLTCL